MAKFVFLAAFLFFQAAAASYSTSLLGDTWGLIEDGEIEPYALVLRNEIINGDHSSVIGRLYGLGATFTAVSELSWVRPASGCAHANLINVNIDLENGHANRYELDAAIDDYAVVLADAVENLRILGQCCVLPSPWPHLTNNCGDYGRIYPFEKSWDLVDGFDSAGKVRCAARDLYTSFGARANNVGAAATSAATGPAISIFRAVEGDLSKFLSVAVDDTCCATKKKTLRSLGGKLKASIFAAADRTKHSYYSKCH